MTKEDTVPSITGLLLVLTGVFIGYQFMVEIPVHVGQITL